MTSRWYNVVVVLFWLATMSWLIVEKIVPSLLRGEPPNYSKIVALDQDALPPPVAWRMLWNDRPIGRAANQTRRNDDGMTEIESRVEIDALPLAEIAPVWIGPLSRDLTADGAALDLSAESVFAVDPLGELVSFHSQLGLGGQDGVITMQGRVEGDELSVTVRSGEFVYTTQSYLPADALVGDVLSPRDRLPGLRVGQTWTVPVYSPFRPANSPLEILQASVERETRLTHGGLPTPVLLVIYRAETGSTGAQVLRGRVWVRRDGLVLKQEMRFQDSRLTFVRTDEAQSAQNEISGR